MTSEDYFYKNVCEHPIISIVAHRVIEKLFQSDHFEHLMGLLTLANERVLSETRNGLLTLGGSILPHSLQDDIVKMALYRDRFRPAEDQIQKLAIAAFLLYDSLYVLLGGTSEDPLAWSPLR